MNDGTEDINVKEECIFESRKTRKMVERKKIQKRKLSNEGRETEEWKGRK